MKPRYPIFIPSKGRSHIRLTVRRLLDDDVPFYLVVEPQEREDYERAFPETEILSIPESGRGVSYVRNWIKHFAKKELGAIRHWQLDDNIKGFRRLFRGRRIPCDASIALRVCEDLTERFENVVLSGLNYQMFVTGKIGVPPFSTNVHVYSCTLILNELPYRWRGRFNEDTDMCLQVLAGGWCTLLLNAFMADKGRTMTLRGGQTDDVYRGDGRLYMARLLERNWPGVVKVRRRFGRPQHVVDWRKFTTPLRRRADAVVASGPNEYGLELRPVR